MFCVFFIFALLDFPCILLFTCDSISLIYNDCIALFFDCLYRSITLFMHYLISIVFYAIINSSHCLLIWMYVRYSDFIICNVLRFFHIWFTWFCCLLVILFLWYIMIVLPFFFAYIVLFFLIVCTVCLLCTIYLLITVPHPNSNP